MANNKNSFGESLLLRERVNDAIHSDMVVIDRLKNLPAQERDLCISDAFNLSVKMTRKIVDNELYIALVEASTYINRDCENIEKVRTLRYESQTRVDHPVIARMVAKYEIMIDLLACGMDPHSQGVICGELDFSRRSAKTVKALLAKQVSKRSEGMTIFSSSSKHCPANLLRQFRLSELSEKLPEIYQEMPKGQHFNGLRLLVELAQKSEIAISKFSDELLINTLETVSNADKENHNG